MNNGEQRHLIITDTHLSCRSETLDNRWFPPQVAKKSLKAQKEFLQRCDRGVQRAFLRLMEACLREGPFNSITSLGDFTSGDREEGMVTPKAQEQFCHFQRLLNTCLLSTSFHSAWGGHDLGYCTASKTIGAGSQGPTRESFAAAEKLLGPPWQAIEMGAYWLTILNSEIINAARQVTDQSTAVFFQKKAHEQREFLDNILWRGRRPIILAIHDPRELLPLWPLLRSHTYRIKLTLAGHFHLSSLGWGFNLAHSWARALNLKIVPSPWGLATPWGPIGHGGFCVLIVNGRHLELQHYRL